MNPLKLFIDKYLFWIKLVVVLLVLAGTVYAWHALTQHYIDVGDARGAARVQAQFDEHKMLDRQILIDSITAARESERGFAKAAAATDSKLIKEKDREQKRLNTLLANSNNDNQRMRLIIGKTKLGPETGMPGAGPGASASDGTCYARLPDDIRAGFNRLQEIAFRAAADANKTGHNLTGAQEIIKADREACNGDAK